MSEYQLNLDSDMFLFPTPAGAYHAVSSVVDDTPRHVLRTLLTQPTSHVLTTDTLLALCGHNDEQEALGLLHRMQRLGWIQGESQPRQRQPESLSDILPPLLSQLSGSAKALLADQQGFCLASHGIPHETAEELSALSADLASLYQRHRGLLEHNMGLNTAAWALVDAAGDSRLGCWPLFVGDQRFALAITGLPSLNQPSFTDLVWALSVRYGAEPADATN